MWVLKVYKKKTFSSMILCLLNKNIMTTALKNLNIDGIRVSTEIFKQNKSNLQCIKCQKFGHHHTTCSAQFVCQFCGLNHETKMHKCHLFNFISICTHLAPKYANCNENHRANDPLCEVVKAVQPKHVIIENKL